MGHFILLLETDHLGLFPEPIEDGLDLEDGIVREGKYANILFILVYLQYLLDFMFNVARITLKKSNDRRLV